jgi:hypothetical protein
MKTKDVDQTCANVEIGLDIAKLIVRGARAVWGTPTKPPIVTPPPSESPPKN